MHSFVNWFLPIPYAIRRSDEPMAKDGTFHLKEPSDFPSLAGCLSLSFHSATPASDSSLT